MTQLIEAPTAAPAPLRNVEFQRATYRRAVERNRSLSRLEKAVLIGLVGRADRRGHCWPSVATIASETGYSKSSVGRALCTLEPKGWLRVDRPTELDAIGRPKHYVEVCGKKMPTTLRYWLLRPEDQAARERPAMPHGRGGHGVKTTPSHGVMVTPEEVKGPQGPAEEKRAGAREDAAPPETVGAGDGLTHEAVRPRDVVAPTSSTRDSTTSSESEPQAKDEGSRGANACYEVVNEPEWLEEEVTTVTQPAGFEASFDALPADVRWAKGPRADETGDPVDDWTLFKLETGTRYRDDPLAVTRELTGAADGTLDRLRDLPVTWLEGQDGLWMSSSFADAQQRLGAFARTPRGTPKPPAPSAPVLLDEEIPL